MNDILELPEVRERIPRISVADYHRRADLDPSLLRTELIRGIIIRKMPKSPLHASIVTILPELLRPQVPHGFFLRMDNPLTLRDSEPEPDLAVVQGSVRDFVDRHPTSAELVVEVAISSVALDRENASLYAEAGVREYWIVLARQRQVEVYRRPENSVYREQRLYSESETLACESVPAIRLALADIFPS